MKRGRSRFFYRLFLSGIVGGLLPTLLCTLLIYAYASNIILEKARENANQSLTQVQLRMDQLLKMQDRQLQWFLSDTTLLDFMRQEPRSEDFVEVGNVRQRMTQTMLYELGIENARLYQTEQAWALTPSALVRGVALEDAFLLEREAPFTLWYPAQDARYVRLARSFPLNARQATGIFSVDISRTLLRGTLLAGGFPGSLYVLDAQGNVLIAQDAAVEGLTLAEALSVEPEEAARAGGAREGSVTLRLNGVQSIVTRVDSAYTPWLYLAVMDAQALLGEIRLLQWLALGVGLALLVLVVLYVFISSRRIYAPVRALYNQAWPHAPGEPGPLDEITLLGQRLEQHDRQARLLFAYRLFNGELDGAAIAAFCEGHGLTLPALCYVCVLKADASQQQPGSGALEGRVLAELERLLQLPLMMIDQGCAMLLGSAEAGGLDEGGLRARLYSLQAAIMEQWDMEVSLFVSTPLSGFEQVRAGFLEACSLFPLQVQYGSSVILFAGQTPPEPVHPPWLPAIAQLDILVRQIQALNHAAAEQALDGLLDVLYTGDLREHTLVFACAKLLVDCLSTLQAYGMQGQAVGIVSQVQLQEVAQCKGREDVRVWMLGRLIRPTVDALIRQQSEVDIRLFMRAKECVAANFETDYTLEMCANDVACTAHALKRAFRNVMNMTYSAYLAKVRLDQAKQWLEETNLRIVDIAERLRFSNAQNFVRSFRKQEGVTPGEYRRIRR